VAVYINKSPQRRESFVKLQTKEPKLMPIQDVRTRWNSTFLMLRRARRLQSAFDTFCAEFNLTDMKMDKDEWRQVDYLLSITYPFFKFTSSLSATTDVTIHNVFGIYNTLFTHIDIRQ
jgi:predicted metalloprotease with PDZ domain